ncbi:hypothetical protein [Pontibacter arcticus]|uniref:SH3 domain-containing protein n=1 Tax=Pontibacter arcticus TaxID=2080288 RepID=A0A364RD05_9BACT|nr:hypothetical protein [Pontibacter arcticus]RAU82211.1 hypothetical protein DP923_10460 [Pontibacter arcticus]
MKKTACFFILLAFTSCNESAREPELQQTEIALSDSTESDTTIAAPPIPATCQTRAPHFAPVKQNITDPALQTYLRELENAVKTQEAEDLLNLLDPKISTGFDGSGGIEAFRKKWKPENKNSEVWPLLNKLLQLGGTHLKEDKTNRSFAMPYVYSAWPDTLDAFTFSAVINDNAPLRQEPDINATALCMLPRVILRVDYARSYPQQDNVPEKEWWYVESPDGQQKGYINKSDLYSPVGYRALFNKNKQGKWLMTALVAGD